MSENIKEGMHRLKNSSPFFIRQGLTQNAKINPVMHRHEHRISKGLGCEGVVSGRLEYEAASHR